MDELPWALRTRMHETGASLIPKSFRIEFLGSPRKIGSVGEYRDGVASVEASSGMCSPRAHSSYHMAEASYSDGEPEGR
jgi:hypothetical protein